MRELLATVEQARRGLEQATRGRALLQALGAALSGVILVRLLTPTLLTGGRASIAARGTQAATATAIVVGLLLGGLLWVLLRPRRTPSGSTAALWIEEHHPGAPSFALVTLVELASEAGSAAYDGSELHRASERMLRQVSIGDALSTLRWQQWRGPVSFVAVSVLLLVMSGMLAPWTAGMDQQASRSTRPGTAGEAAAPLGAWRVRVTPPDYVGGRTETFGDVAFVSALAGSIVEIRGDGLPPDITSGRVDSAAIHPLSAQVESAGWRVHTEVEPAPTTVRLARGGRTRLLVIEGHVDTIPSVTLQTPARDSVFREAQGTLPLTAIARDDFGVTRAWFELIVTSREGERFTVRTLAMGEKVWAAGTHQRQASIALRLDLGALKLVPGDVVHLRAVARDGYPSPARELGSSETRSFRIARPAEYDSVAVEPAPPPEVDKSLLSQRMLLMLTEKLDRQQQRMARGDVVRESQRLARDQARVRQSVGDIIFQRLSGEASGEHSHFAGDGHDHGVDLQDGKLSVNAASTSGMLEEGDDSPVIAINKPLLEAYNAMWDAGRALEQGDPHAAIRPMQLALEAIERSRTASRVYLRGRPPQVIIDIEKIRLAGKDTGRVASREARRALPPHALARDAKLVVIAQLLARAQRPAADSVRVRLQDAARDSLALLRVESLADAPAFAASLTRVLDGLAQGGDLTATLVDARRTLGNVERAPVGRWSRMVPP